MRGAPPVQLACGPDAPWRWFGQALTALALATVSGWAALALGSGDAAAWLARAIAGGLGWALVTTRTARLDADGPDPVLAWDGQRWTFQGHPGEVSVMLDFDRWVLLRVRTTTAVRWVAITLAARTADAGGSGAMFRAALQAHAGQSPGLNLEGRVRDADG